MRWQKFAVVVAVLAACAAVSRHQLTFWRDSEALFNHGLAVTRNNRTAHNLLGVVLFKRGDLDGAEAHWREAIRIEPTDAEAYNNLGILFQQRGDMDAAQAHFQQAVLIERNNSEFLNNLGQLLATRNRHKEAAACYQLALRLTDKDAKIHYNLAVTLTALGDFDKAWQHYTRAMELDNHYAFNAHRNFGVAQLKAGKFPAAISYLDQATKLDPQNPDGHNDLGGAYFAAGEISRAIEEYRKALMMKPDFADAHNNLGLALLNERETNGAIAEFSRALSIQSNHILARENLADVLFALQKMPDALSNYLAVLEADSNKAPVHFRAAMIFAAQRDTAAALKHLREAVRLSPDSVEALNALAWILATDNPKDNDATESVTLAERAVTLTDSANPSVLDTLAAAYAACGRFNEAIQTAQRAIELATSAGNARLASEIRRHLQQYEQSIAR